MTRLTRGQKRASRLRRLESLGTVRISLRGVPHITGGSHGLTYSICWFQSSGFYRVFTPYQSSGIYQTRQDFKDPDEVVAYIRLLAKAASKKAVV